jgi:centromere protein S
MVWVQCENVAQDLSSFAQHAGRRVVNTDDVLLLCRRNEPLEELLRGFVEQEMVKEVEGNASGRSKGKGKAKAGKT